MSGHEQTSRVCAGSVLQEQRPMRLQQGGTGSSEAAVARRAPQLGSRVSSYEFGLRFASRSNWTPTSAFLGRTAFVFSWSCRLGAQGRATTPRTGQHEDHWTPTYADGVCCFLFWSCRLGAQGRATTPRTGEHKDYRTPTYADRVCFFLSCRLGAQGRATTPRICEYEGYWRPKYADCVCCFFL